MLKTYSQGLYTSIGMNFSELQQLAIKRDLNTSDSDTGRRFMSVARDFGVSRVTVHEDRWALSFTRGTTQ